VQVFVYKKILAGLEFRTHSHRLRPHDKLFAIPVGCEFT